MITVGTDPEFFFAQDGNVYPAKLAFQAGGFSEKVDTMFGRVIVDGAAIELNPLPGPPQEVLMNTAELLKFAVQEMESKVDQTLEIVPELPIDLRWAERDEDLAVFGCDPDDSIWGRDLRPDSINAAKHPYRYGGFHIHIGIDEWGDDNVKAMDYSIGLASMALGNGMDSRRREIYGKPGVYRIQRWGMEYRTPSNILLQSPVYSEFAFVVTDYVMRNLKMLNDCIELVPEDVLVSCLTGTDPEDARQLYNLISTSVGLPELPEEQTNDWKNNWGIK